MLRSDSSAMRRLTSSRRTSSCTSVNEARTSGCTRPHLTMNPPWSVSMGPLYAPSLSVNSVCVGTSYGACSGRPIGPHAPPCAAIGPRENCRATSANGCVASAAWAAARSARTAARAAARSSSVALFHVRPGGSLLA